MARDMLENNDGSRPPRDVWRSMWRGVRERCPNCGEGHLFRRYLKVADACPACGEDLHHQRADDAPAYFTIVIVGHFVVAGVLWMERAYSPADWVQAAVWLPLTLGATLWLLPRVKGALVGLQWALRMHGFGGMADQVDPPSAPRPAAE
jgi:uncharacterized protein (DUF983 family)